MESRMGTDCKNNPPPCSGVAGIRVQIRKAYPCLSARPAVDLEGVGAFSHVGDIVASLGIVVYGVWEIAGWLGDDIELAVYIRASKSIEGLAMMGWQGGGGRDLKQTQLSAWMPDDLVLLIRR
ncbi:hypothetical protein V8C43DRAFT_298640 [Trichoderma afarasin]